MSRTAYLTQLRRAFLLRVHPDRFRNHTTVQTQQQASLVKALANRMSQADFTAWLQQRDRTQTNSALQKQQQQQLRDAKIACTYQYVIEKRDGSLLQSTLSLGGTVDEILNDIASTLQKSGVGSIPVPPIERPSPLLSTIMSTTCGPSSNVVFHDDTFTSTSSVGGEIDPRYDVRSNVGRDLHLFLRNESSLSDQVRELRAARIDAMSVALQVRRVFQFAAVDATETGWSSASVVMLFRRLLALHAEFADKLHVTSFYPIRLVFSPRDIPDDRSSALDLHGGILRLNPASTSIQWLDTLQLVSNTSIQQIQMHRECLIHRTKAIQSSLHVRLSKGFTSSSLEYHNFLDRLTMESDDDVNRSEPNQVSSLLPTVEPLQAVVEADSVCRRAIVTSAGLIRLGADMSKEECIHSIHRLSRSARDQLITEQAHLNQCQDAMSNLKWKLGLHKVYRTGGVSHTEFLDCLSRLLAISQRENGLPLFHILAGNALGIAITGQSCQLADDGSVVIPHNWT
jgi:Domain of unknown function (DUF4461)